MSTSLDKQVGGNHYKKMKIQIVEFCHANSLDFFQGCIIKYVCRDKGENRIQDLEKARHFLDMLIEFEKNK